MSFDRLAPHYRWMEWLLAGNKLQRCRTAFLPEVRNTTRVLSLGEGNGRFLNAFTRINPTAEITIVDSSERMLQQAQRRASLCRSASLPIQFVHADIFTWKFPSETFDLIVTNFFLDCFRADQIAVLVPRIAAASTARAQWLISDFRLPARGPTAWRARWIVGAMYRFFRIVTGISASTLTPADSILERSHFQLGERRVSEWGLLHADRWQRHAGGDAVKFDCRTSQGSR